MKISSAKIATIVALCFMWTPLQSHAGIERVEPPHWWVGMQNTSVELLIYGDNIGAYDVQLASSDTARAKISKRTRTDNPNYLFVTLDIATNAAAGVLTLNFTHPDRATLQHHYELKARQFDPQKHQGFSNRDLIYLLTPDRFANGDPRNDSHPNYRDRLNRADPYGRHGGDLQGIIDHLDYLQSLGVTQLWLNPVVENAMQEASYHGYAGTDFYKVDPRYGSNALYQTLAAQARARGIGLIIDLVPNHSGIDHWWLRDMPAADWVNHGGKFVETNHMRETLQDIHAARADQQAFTDGWFVPTMPDLNQRNPLLANYLTQNAIWWIESAQLSGIRVDTWSYSDKDFLRQWVASILTEYPRLTIVGEEWSTDPNILAYWQRGQKNADGYSTQIPSLFDFPLQADLIASLAEQESWNSGLVKLYRSLSRDRVYADASALTIFADNHDMSRVHTQLGHDPALTRMALTLVATLRGIPQIFYGTEILMANPGTDSHGVIRTDFPGGWSGDKVNAFTGKGLSTEARAMQAYVRQLFSWRKTATAIHTGALRHYAPKDGVYTFFRFNNAERWMIVVNKNATAKMLDTNPLREDLAGYKSATEVFSQRTTPLREGLSLAAKSVTIFRIQ
ncbi:glycoside hydrolase family 13 protein [Simiduia aestuariiviva]|uniref:Neopullulanase n=1 Tax=Simiduia aestuariiviva TaxID=1510459 RepID=A0A839USF6_9GAMM|nr:glycoside hydrolase family 13 protein [Simiduia aestuariiviva]MBB3169631.1 neopullulanase [Simiduia aestuariiviva]